MKKKIMGGILLASVLLGVSACGNETASKADTKTEQESQESQGKYKDGTYTGHGVGYENGETVVEVSIKSGNIEEISIVSTQDDEDYILQAEKITEDMVEKQTADVDSVTGATFSSQGIKSAVEDALSQAK